MHVFFADKMKEAFALQKLLTIFFGKNSNLFAYNTGPECYIYPHILFSLQVVTQPGMVIAGPIGAPPPPDYMIPSILVCLFCFCPTGIVAVYYAHRVRSVIGGMKKKSVKS